MADLFNVKLFKSYEINNFFNLFTKVEELQDILNVVALHGIMNKTFKILFYKTSADDGTEGSANYLLSEIFIGKNLFLSEVKSTFIHEIGHYAMFEVFNNNFKPYKIYDVNSRKAYELAIYECLDNIHKELFGIQNPIKYNSSYEFGTVIVIKKNEVSSSFYEYWKFPTDKTSFIDSFLEVYSYESYSKKNEHAEFIVRYEQGVAAGYGSDILQITQPLKNYLEEYVKPAMREYVYNHSMNHLLMSPLEKYINSKDQMKLDDSASFHNETCMVKEFDYDSHNAMF